MTTDAISFLVKCYEVFCQNAEQEIGMHERATAKAAAANKAKREKQKQEEAARRAELEAEREARARFVDYTLSLPGWSGIKEFCWTNKMDHRRNATLVLSRAMSVVAKENKLFPQLEIVDGGKRVIVTLLGCRGWWVTEVSAKGDKVNVEIRRR